MKILLSLLICWQAQAADTPPKKMVIIGDSITEGFGIKREMAYPQLLQQRLDKEKLRWRVINSGISGSTSASAVSRIAWHLKQKPDLIVLALGGNDGLRGSDVKAMEENLNKAIELAKRAGVKIVLAGMKVPPNYGAAYSASFEAVFSRVARKNSVPLIPFLLEHVGGDKNLNLEDGIHPNEKGHAIIADTVFKALRSYL